MLSQKIVKSQMDQKISGFIYISAESGIVLGGNNLKFLRNQKALN